ncbi:MAG: exosortase system-associated protein, TIGR04073 family [Verrucomicrobiota bacterium]|jgi:putative exosortase-associated protein (TIGR04073 family)
MRKLTSTWFPLLGLVLLAAGCAGPQEKLGRGVNNILEIARLGELRRSMEQTAVLNNPDSEFTGGAIKGMDRTMRRTAAGFYEIATFPFPNHSPKNYDPIFFSGPPALHISDPVYPDSYKPAMLSDQITSPDTSLGFGGGDLIPFVPGSRFHVFDQ